VRILHLSDFHLGTFSLNGRSLRKAVAWADEREYDLALVTGDLLSRRRGARALRQALGMLSPRLGAFTVLGNHDIAETHDPFSRPGEADAVAEAGAVLLADAARTIEVGGARLQLVGLSPESFRTWRAPGRLVDPGADLRILLCHFPNVIDKLPSGAFDLVLAGHLHAGQICIPYPGGRLRLAHVRWTYVEGLYQRPGGVLHLSAGLGTTFVPFRFFARPAAYELHLHSSA
jgi:uncharacterized protein